MKKILKRLVLMVVLGVIVAVGLKFGLYYWSTQPVAVTDEVTVPYPAETSLKSLAADLEDKALIGSGELFVYLVKTSYDYSKFQAGEYLFQGEVTPKAIIETLVQGKIAPEKVVQIAIPEGFTQKQIFKRLAENGLGEEAEYWRLSKDREFIRGQNIRAKSLEGYLYPATYDFAEKATEQQVLEKMIATFFSRLPSGYVEQLKKSRLTLNEAVTFASLIETETNVDEERPMVAEVIWNRLRDRSPLGIDSALIYGIKDYDGDIRWKHLRDKSNPYNTRIHKGLPPGPVASPARPSLAAVIAPTKKGYYYYVLKAGTNRHHFSKSLKEHNRHVKKLVRELKK